MSNDALVVLVSPNGDIIGTQEKLAAHQDNALHLAFSVMLYRKTSIGIEVLMQQRALNKYHSGGLWANTCCSHPLPEEAIKVAAQRRIAEELNITSLIEWHICGEFIYQASFANGLHEHELDTVLIGEFNEALPTVNPDEVAQLKWIKLKELNQAVSDSPQQFAVWVPFVLTKVNESLAAL
jgi:isopentenyl-diphosphate delta-isomerase